MKKIYRIGIILISIVMLICPVIQAITEEPSIRMQPKKPVGAFKIIIYPPTEPITINEIREIEGIHQLIPGALDSLFPTLWVSQYSELDVKEQPEWAEVIIPQKNIITPPDGLEHQFYLYVTLQEDAPPNTVGTVSISITTGKFMRTMFPPWFPFCSEFHLDQEFYIQTGDF